MLLFSNNIFQFCCHYKNKRRLDAGSRKRDKVSTFHSFMFKVTILVLFVDIYLLLLGWAKNYNFDVCLHPFHAHASVKIPGKKLLFTTYSQQG